MGKRSRPGSGHRTLKRGGKGEFSPVVPWPAPSLEECAFYHTMTYPNGESVDGHWDLRGLFPGYIGNYPIQGKSVLDVGTASGFLAFEAERAGARVTAMDASSTADFDRLHFRGSRFHYNRGKHVRKTVASYTSLKAGFWYSWHRFDSDVEVVYAPLSRLPYWKRKFDVVIAGAILEHLADPVTTIGSLAALADEALILAFTPVVDSPEQVMQTASDWSDPANDYTF